MIVRFLRRRPALAAIACVSALLAATPAYADIDNTGTDAGTIQTFGFSNTATYGQTFTAGAGDTTLSSFSMFLRTRYSGSGTLDLRGYIATWDGNKAGSLLYTSGTQTMNAAGTLQEFAFAPSIAVTPGANYVAFLSVSELGTQTQSTFGMPLGGNTIPGSFVFLNNGTNFGSLFTNNWSQDFAGQNDAWLKVDFNAANAVPEPATWAMMLVGFGAIGGTLRRRQKVTAGVRFA